MLFWYATTCSLLQRCQHFGNMLLSSWGYLDESWTVTKLITTNCFSNHLSNRRCAATCLVQHTFNFTFIWKLWLLRGKQALPTQTCIYIYTRTHARTSYNTFVWVTAVLSWLPWRHTRILFKAEIKVLGRWNSAWILLYPVVRHSRLQQMYKLNLVTRWPAKCRVRDGAPNSRTGSVIMLCLVRVTA